MSLLTRYLYGFGKFRLDAQEKVLWCEDKLVPLTPKLFETLLLLVERHGHIVEKQELLDRVWPDTFVEEANVARHVSLLRKALGEWADASEMIETLPRRGYRFVAPVQQFAAANGNETALARLSTQHNDTPANDQSPVADEILVETHTITRITAEEESQEAIPPPIVTSLAPPTGKPAWQPRTRTLTVCAISLIVIAGLWLFLTRNKAAINEQDTLLLAEFVNRTGDPVFDRTLRQGLAVQLEQSPFLNFLSDQRVRETLKLMTRSSEEPITPEIGREICVRQGLKALIHGEIAPLGNHYVLTLEAIAGQTGDTLARAQSEAESTEHVLHALSLAAREFRGKLGEKLSSLQKYDALLESTTSSLPALQNLAIAIDLNNNGKSLEAMTFAQRAVELDPNFASAWSYLAAHQSNSELYRDAAASITHAYDLRERATEQERFRIELWYYQFKIRDLEKAVEVLELFRRNYPRSNLALNSLSVIYMDLGQFDLARDASRAAVSLNPNGMLLQVNLAGALLATGELAESKAILNKFRDMGMINRFGRRQLFFHTLLEENDVAFQREVDALKGQRDEEQTWQWLAGIAAIRGQAHQIQGWADKAIAMGTQPRMRGRAAHQLSAEALFLAVLCSDGVGKPACDIGTMAQQAATPDRDDLTLSDTMLALALNGRMAEAQTLAAELQAQAPQGTLFNGLWLPLLRAIQALHDQQPEQAIEALRPTEKYEAGSYFRVQYLRGLAWLQLRNGPAAAAEFEKIRTHRYWAPSSPLWPLAHLGLARAAALQGDNNKSRQLYEEFLKLWKDADSDLPALRAAKAELARLH